ncbi:concanavalin A-like lectin/glucanase domain-containing protein [Gaertneriomyces semiglobifer]|nr:concanavalin A-like lectin/glucanase domain-containing protein [Gaertneriomyces semiglobifer]
MKVAGIIATAAAVGVASVNAQYAEESHRPTGAPPGGEGNCVTGTYTFKDNNRIARIAPNVGIPQGFDYSSYDFVVQENPTAFNVQDGLASLSLIKPATGNATVTKAAHSRWVKYAKISAKMSAVAVPGVVTTLITMSERGDEIDWETVGNDPNNIQTNIFYKGILEYGKHGDIHPVQDIGAFHTYEIDWKSSGLTFSIDGRVVRTVTPTSENAKSAMLPAGENWYPTTASLIQFSVWEHQGSWAGGPVDWSKHPTNMLPAWFESLDIQCYDDKDQPVPAWPANAADLPAGVKKGDTGKGTPAPPGTNAPGGGAAGGGAAGGGAAAPAGGAGGAKTGSPSDTTSAASPSLVSAFSAVGALAAAVAALW